MIVAGFGFRTSASVESLRAAFDLASDGHKVTALASAGDKAQATCLTTLAGALSLPIFAMSATAIKATKTATQSPRVLRECGTGSVAEAAALAAAGPGSRLVSPRQISPDRLATCAIAIGEKT